MFLLALVCGICAYAQQRIFEEGKSWIVNEYYFEGEIASHGKELRVVGDTLINDTLAVKISVVSLDSHRSDYFDYAYEEDGKVYLYYEGETGYGYVDGCFMLLYDFDWQVGDSISWDNNVVSVDYMTIEGVSRKVLTLGYEGYTQGYEYLIEGIGATGWDDLFSLLHLIPAGNYLGSELISCHKDGVCLFSRERFYAQIKGTDGIGKASAEAAGDGGIYDLYGRPVSAPVKGQIYIRDGKKAVWRD